MLPKIDLCILILKTINMSHQKPIKRNQALVDYSKDHYFGLVLVSRIKEGLKNAIDPKRISQYVIHFFETDLMYHFKDEEEILFVKLLPTNKLRVQAESEHQIIYQLINTLKAQPDHKITLELFADTLKKHIRFEERALFNYMQENLTEELLTEISSSIRLKKQNPKT
jgi:hemerythrin-like domain-containing protein